LEAVEGLAAMGADKQAVLSAIASGMNRKKIEEGENHDDYSSATLISAVLELVEAHFAKYRHQTASALQLFLKLERDFPNNVYLLLKIATIQVSRDDELYTDVLVCISM
jgi:hypothetical protein